MADIIVPLHVDIQNIDNIEHAILTAMARRLSQLFASSLGGIRAGIQEEVGHAIRRSPEYDSLNRGDLWHELGVPDPAGATEAIISAIAGAIQITNHGFRVEGNNFAGGVTIEILRSDFSDLLGLREASFISVSRRRGTSIRVPWLEWLLLGGHNLLVSNFRYLGEDDTSPYSRTSLGIMVPSKAGWGLETRFAGTETDNWLTRALKDLKQPMVDVIVRELSRRV